MGAPTAAARLLGLSVLGSIALLGAQAPAHAAGSFLISFDTPYNGDVPKAVNGSPVGPGNPALFATFTDTGIANQVKLELQGNLPINEYIDGLAFNLASSILPNTLSVFSCTAPGNICTTYGSTFPSRQNSFALQGNGNGNGFDFGFEFNNSNNNSGANRFNGTELVTLVINGPVGLNALSFAFVNSPTGSGSDFVGYGGAKINGILPSGSGAVGGSRSNGTTSVPGPLPILGAAAALAYSRRLRSRIRSSRQQATIS